MHELVGGVALGPCAVRPVNLGHHQPCGIVSWRSSGDILLRGPNQQTSAVCEFIPALVSKNATVTLDTAVMSSGFLRLLHFNCGSRDNVWKNVDLL